MVSKGSVSNVLQVCGIPYFVRSTAEGALTKVRMVERQIRKYVKDNKSFGFDSCRRISVKPFYTS